MRRFRQEETSQLEALRNCYKVPSGGELREVKADASRKNFLWDLWSASQRSNPLKAREQHWRAFIQSCIHHTVYQRFVPHAR